MRPDIHLLYQGQIGSRYTISLNDLCRRLSLGQPPGLETVLCCTRPIRPLQSPLFLQGPAGRSLSRQFYMFIQFLFQVACVSAGSLKSACFLSTASMYATSFLATASVALFRFPFFNSCSCTIASCSFQRGASFAASMSMVCRCLFLFLEMGPRCSFPADSFCALHSPQ